MLNHLYLNFENLNNDILNIIDMLEAWWTWTKLPYMCIFWFTFSYSRILHHTWISVSSWWLNAVIIIYDLKSSIPSWPVLLLLTLLFVCPWLRMKLLNWCCFCHSGHKCHLEIYTIFENNCSAFIKAIILFVFCFRIMHVHVLVIEY